MGFLVYQPEVLIRVINFGVSLMHLYALLGFEACCVLCSLKVTNNTLFLSSASFKCSRETLI